MKATEINATKVYTDRALNQHQFETDDLSATSQKTKQVLNQHNKSMLKSQHEIQRVLLNDETPIKSQHQPNEEIDQSIDAHLESQRKHQPLREIQNETQIQPLPALNESSFYDRNSIVSDQQNEQHSKSQIASQVQSQIVTQRQIEEDEHAHVEVVNQEHGEDDYEEDFVEEAID